MAPLSAQYLVYAAHAAAWGLFGATLVALREPGGPAAPQAPAAAAPKSAPFARALVAFHSLGFGVLYFGLGDAVVGAHAPRVSALQQALGALLILGGGALMAWARLHFRSWRLQARLDEGHELATGGPFSLLRHPIYAGIDLLGFGTALWAPTPLVLLGAALLLLGSDLRSRAEERLLLEAFGERYRAYMASAKRLIPGVY